MNPKKNKTLITVIVVIVGLSMVFAYMPLLFLPQPSAAPVFEAQDNESASSTEDVYATSSPELGG